MNDPRRLATVVVPEDEAASYWQPLPSCGYVTVSLTPDNMPFDTFSAGTQVLPPGRHVRQHAHTRNHELIFIYEGRGTCTIEGVTREIGPGTTVLFSRHDQHTIENTGDADMKLFWVFFPPALEDWFAAIGKPRQPGDPAPEPFPRPDDGAEIMARMRFVPPPAPPKG